MESQSFSNAAPVSLMPAKAVSLSPLGSLLPTLDFETRSKADIKKVGAYRYSMDPSTSVLCVVYDLKDGKGRRLWHPWAGGNPSDLLAHAQNGGVLEAHNFEFEYCVWNFVCTRLYGWPKLSFKQGRCSAAKAAALALPRPLEDLGAALEVPVKKDMDGRRLMLKMSRPRKPTKNDPSEWVEGVHELERLFQYCETDVVAEEHCSLAMPDLSERELAVFRLTQKINERGIYCDRALCETAVRFSKQFEHDLTHELRELTGGAVTTAKQVAKLSAFLSEEGVEVENLQAKTVGDLLKAGVDSATAKRVLEIRQLLGKSSISKFQAMLNMAGPDDRIRGTLLYHGASTGRWAGRGIQPQNYPQGKIKDVHNIYAALADGDYEWFRTLFPDVFTALSASLRGMLRAPTGRELIAADFSAIEARVVCWLAGDFANLEVYINGEDPYKLMASAIFNVPVSQVTKAQRELGKRAVLGCVAEGTNVLTKSGMTKIEHITYKDQVWNGTNWTKHGGLLPKGLKTVIKIEPLNIELTPDHWVLTPNGWQTAGEIASNADMIRRLSDQQTEGLRLCPLNIKSARNAVSACAAYAELKKNVELTDFIEAKTYFVDYVLNHSTDKKVDAEEIGTFFWIQNFESVGRLVSTISKNAATIPMTKTSQGMAVAEYPSPSSPIENFWNTLLRSMGLTNPDSPWTELIMTEGMSRETFDSFLNPPITKTRVVQSYDLLNCDGNSFQVGGAIVHNCGFGMGWEKFMATCEAQGQPVTADLAQRAVNAYRYKYAAVKAFWNDIEEAAIRAVKYPGKRFDVNELIQWLVKGKFLYCRLPSGRVLSYYAPKIERRASPYGERDQLTYMAVDSKTKQWVREGTYGGKLTENVVQATARDVMVDAMFRVERCGYELILSVHDELVAEIPEGFGSVEEFERLMTELPVWAKGLPIKAEGFRDVRYRK